jgi:MFS family permease
MAAAGASPRIPLLVWILGWVSLLTDISSEMILAVLPVYLGVGMGVSTATIGLIEGIAEAMAAVVRAFAGALGDRLGRYKGLVVLGYGISALSKIAFPLAGTPAPVFAARIVDRIGKGLRTAPRDAMIARAGRPRLGSLGSLGPVLAGDPRRRAVAGDGVDSAAHCEVRSVMS